MSSSIDPPHLTTLVSEYKQLSDQIRSRSFNNNQLKYLNQQVGQINSEISDLTDRIHQLQQQITNGQPLELDREDRLVSKTIDLFKPYILLYQLAQTMKN